MKTHVPSEEFFERFIALRDDLFKAIGHNLEQDGHCKTYEGMLSLVWPNYFVDDFTITLSCYVIGPSRHYEWRGKSFDEALNAAETDIRTWIAEEYADD